MNDPLQDIASLFNNDLFSDLTLVVNGERFLVHKNILAIRNEYFRGLLTTNLRESNQKDIIIHESNTQMFEKLVRCIYSGEKDVTNTNVDECIEMLMMANKYLVYDMQRSIEEKLRALLTMDNFCLIYSAAFACSAANLQTYCVDWTDSRAPEILRLAEFSTLHVDAVGEIINRNSFVVSQVELFDAISKWFEANGGKKEKASILLSNVRLTEMPLTFLVTMVRESGLFNESRILDAVATMCSSSGTSKFDAILKWMKTNAGKQETSMLLSKFRLTEMPLSFLVTKVRESGLFSESGILEAVAAMCSSPGTKTTSASDFVNGFSVIVQREGGLYRRRTSMTIDGLYPYDTVARLKKEIRRNSGCDVTVSYSGMWMEDHRTLASYGIVPNANLIYHCL